MQETTLLALSLGMRAAIIGPMNINHNGVRPELQSQLEHFRKLTQKKVDIYTSFQWIRHTHAESIAKRTKAE
jgi:hypothetical protein